MATVYTKNVQKLLNEGTITKEIANNLMRKKRLSSFHGNPLEVIKNTNNIQNKLKNNFIGKYTQIRISGSNNQCYARTTLFVLLLYINRNEISFREFLRIVNSDFSFIPLDPPSLTIDEQSVKNKLSQAKIGDHVILLLGNILSNEFKDTQNNKTYLTNSLKFGHGQITNEIKRNPLEIILMCKDKSKRYGKEVEIKLKDYITDRYDKVTLIKKNKEKTKQINYINKAMVEYYNNERNKELVIEKFISMYHNSKLFNDEEINSILRDYFKYWSIKIQIIHIIQGTSQGTSLNHIFSELNIFLKGNPYVVFITKFLNNIPFFNSLVFYNYNSEDKKLSIIKYGKSISIENLGRNQIYDKNAPVLVGTSAHQEVAVNIKFFNDLNKNNWPKYNTESTQYHNNGGVGQPKPLGLTNANRTKMKNFLKSKIKSFNKNKNAKKKSINSLKDEKLLKEYLIKKLKNLNIRNYNLENLLKEFKQSEEVWWWWWWWWCGVVMVVW